MSQTAASNYPAGSDSPATLDDTQRAHGAFIAQLRDGKGHTNPVTLASATTTDIGGQNSQFVEISGTTTITSFGTTYNGPRYLRFTGALLLTYNATTLNLPGAANITTAAGDTAIAVPNLALNGWTVVFFQRAATASYAAAGANSDITSWSGGALAGLRNRLVNGAMAIDQEFAGAATTFTAGAVLRYAIDQWYAYSTGANVTGQRVAGTAPNQFNYQFTGAASVTKIGYAQRMEAANTQDLAGTTATLSVDLANTLLTTVTWTAWRANTADTFGTLASPTRTQIGTGTFTVTGTLTRYNAQITVTSASTTGIEVEFSVGAQTSGTFTIGRAQLEQGGTATAFESTRPFSLELALCQRYYERIGGASGFPSFSGYTPSGGTLTFNVFWRVEKRTTPTVAVAGTWFISNAGQPSVDSPNTTGCRAVVVIGGAGIGYAESNSSDDVITATARIP